MSGLTPEGKVKKRVSAMLQSFGPRVYYNMPVPTGFGESMLDYVGCVAGVFFMVETKRPGKVPTDRQRQCASRVERAGGKIFVIDSVDSPVLVELGAWLHKRLNP